MKKSCSNSLPARVQRPGMAAWIGWPLLLLLVACASGPSDLRETERKSYRRIVFPGVGPVGIFDASLASEPGGGRVWMSYSSVAPSYRWSSEHPHTVSTRLAFSEDRGATWIDSGLWLNRSDDVTQPVGRARCGKDACTWNFEVSRLVYDAGAPTAERWKLFYHRYLLVDGDREFRIGWIGMKQAPVPTALATAAEVVLMAGSAFERVSQDAIIANRDCLAFTEPGALSQGDDLYLAVHCVRGRSVWDGSILLYRLRHSDESWQLVGPLLDNREDSAALRRQGLPVEGFSAPDLFASRGRLWLVITPTRGGFPSYQGCYFFAVEDLAKARLVGPGKDVHTEHVIVGRSHNGACGYSEQAPLSGVILSEVHPDETAAFQMFQTGMGL